MAVLPHLLQFKLPISSLITHHSFQITTKLVFRSYAMFIRLLSITSLSLLAIANPLARRDTSSQCDTGNIQCCQETQTVDEYNKNATAHGAIPIDLDILGHVGLGCSPITVIGTGGGATCSQEPVCCSDNQYYGLINIGCTPINIYL